MNTSTRLNVPAWSGQGIKVEFICLCCVELLAQQQLSAENSACIRGESNEFATYLLVGLLMDDPTLHPAVPELGRFSPKFNDHLLFLIAVDRAHQTAILKSQAVRLGEIVDIDFSTLGRQGFWQKLCMCWTSKNQGGL